MSKYSDMFQKAADDQATVDVAAAKERDDRNAKHEAFIQAGIDALQGALNEIRQAAEEFALHGLEIKITQRRKIEYLGEEKRVWPCYICRFGKGARESGTLVIASDGLRSVVTNEDHYVTDGGFVVGDAYKGVAISDFMQPLETAIDNAVRNHIRTSASWPSWRQLRPSS